MDKKLSSSELKALAIAALMRDARTSLDFSEPVEKITSRSYNNSPAQAIMINLALRSLPKKVDQYIVLAVWASLPQYAGIEKVTERRSKLKEDIHFPKTTKTLSNKEDGNFAKIAKKCVSYSPDRLKAIVDEGLAKYYDEKNDRVILPELVLPGSETGNAAAAPNQAAG